MMAADHMNLKNNCQISVFDFVGMMQKGAKGSNFRSIGFDKKPDKVCLVSAEYLPQCPDPDNPSRVEHLLEKVRRDFPGISFQLLSLEWDGEKFLITKL
jgi:hypothetical protein